MLLHFKHFDFRSIVANQDDPNCFSVHSSWTHCMLKQQPKKKKQNKKLVPQGFWTSNEIVPYI
jgi:hypothetical protein